MLPSIKVDNSLSILHITPMNKVQPIKVGDTTILELDDNGAYEGCILMKKVSKTYRRKTYRLIYSIHRTVKNIGPRPILSIEMT